MKRLMVVALTVMLLAGWVSVSQAAVINPSSITFYAFAGALTGAMDPGEVYDGPYEKTTPPAIAHAERYAFNASATCDAVHLSVDANSAGYYTPGPPEFWIVGASSSDSTYAPVFNATSSNLTVSFTYDLSASLNIVGGGRAYTSVSAALAGVNQGYIWYSPVFSIDLNSSTGSGNHSLSNKFIATISVIPGQEYRFELYLHAETSANNFDTASASGTARAYLTDVPKGSMALPSIYLLLLLN